MNLLAWLLIALTLPGTVELLLLTLNGLRPRRGSPPPDDPGYRMAVVVPAHDEQASIADCVASLLASEPAVPVVVVADNCTDDTAALAEAAGARVLIRDDPDNHGKGFALDFAFTTLMSEGLAGFVVVDADTEVDPGFLPAMRARLADGADAAQCRYGVKDAQRSPRTRLARVALWAFNVLRPRGRDRMGLSAGICGNGFALAAHTLGYRPYKARSVVEDLEYHVDLVRAGYRVRFVDEVEVRGEVPSGGQGAETQRARWEGGRLRMMIDLMPQLWREVVRGGFRLIEPALELCLLPLSWHVGALALAAGLGSGVARWAALAGLGAVGLHVAGALVVGRAAWKDVLVLASTPAYVAWKLAILPSIARASKVDAGWHRTERGDDDDDT